jgi:hypothetical protein
MSRGFTTAFATALTQRDLRPCMLLEATFPSGTLRLWTGTSNILWNGQTWFAAGTLLSVPEVEESTDVVAAGITVALSGVPVGLVSDVIASVKQGSPATVYIGLMIEDGAIISDPTPAFTGRLDVPKLTDGADTCVIEVTYESRAIDMNHPCSFRLTDDSQQTLYPGDTSLRYVAALQSGRSLFWGPKKK